MMIEYLRQAITINWKEIEKEAEPKKIEAV